MKLSQLKDSVASLCFIIGIFNVHRYSFETLRMFLVLAALFDVMFVLNSEMFDQEVGNNLPSWVVIFFLITIGYIAATRMENRI